mmetsp:Transcript_6730/g.13677  ORF Transcript_6730/g.13677 Transcript_6730/m.13677 type:complete len:847 (-) Transcript_6730:3575-6115(-)
MMLGTSNRIWERESVGWSWFERCCVRGGGAAALGGDGTGSGDPVSALAFDELTELVWVGTSCGWLHAHRLEAMERPHSSRPILPGIQAVASASAFDVRDLVSTRFGCVVAAQGGVSWYRHGGIRVGMVSAPAQMEARSLCLSPVHDSHVFTCGGTTWLSLLDVERARVLQQSTLVVDSVHGAVSSAWTNNARVILVASAGGRISLRDPTSLKEFDHVSPFFGTPTCVVTKGNLFATSSYLVQDGISYVDPMVTLFDIRMLKVPARTIPFTPGPWRLAFDRQGASDMMLWCLSIDGSVASFSDTHDDPLDSFKLDASGDSFTTFRLSKHGLMAFGDSGGFAHLWASSDQASANEIRCDIPNVRPMANSSVLTGSPFISSILENPLGGRIPFLSGSGKEFLSDTKLLSLTTRKPFARFPPKIERSVLQESRRQDWVLFARAPAGFVRNSPEGFVAEKRISNKGRVKIRDPTTIDDPVCRYLFAEIDLVAQEGVEGFDFASYNRSQTICGLQNALPHSYVNSAIQALFFMRRMREELVDHFCEKDVCLSCELGFLFHMLKIGDPSVACEAWNFTRAFARNPLVEALGLLDIAASKDRPRSSSRIEKCMLYLVEQLERDTNTHNSIVREVLGSEVLISGMYFPSKTPINRKTQSLMYKLAYEAGSSTTDCPKRSERSFTDLLLSSLEKTTVSTRAFCQETGNFEELHQTRRIQTAPQVLLISCESEADGYDEFWSGEGIDIQDIEEASRAALASSPRIPTSLAISNCGDLDNKLIITELNDDEQREGALSYDILFVVSFVPSTENWVVNIKIPGPSPDSGWCVNSIPHCCFFFFSEMVVICTLRHQVVCK